MFAQIYHRVNLVIIIRIQKPISVSRFPLRTIYDLRTYFPVHETIPLQNSDDTEYTKNLQTSLIR